MKKHIFFDLDRTLWDFETNSHETLLEICEKYNLTNLGINNYADFIKKYKDINEKLWDLYRDNKITQKDLRRDRFQQTLSQYQITDFQLSEKIGEDYIDICPRKTKLFPYTIEVLDYLQSKYQLHIITNGFHKTQHIKLEHSNLTPYFHQIITSEKVGVKKPNPKIFEFSLSKVNASVEESVYIGDDLEVDVLGCQNCGIDGVYFNPKKIEHQENPKYEISCLSDLKGLF
ncbi:MAG: noncanonical pyrimidine nucleotidase, YjjG family [Flavobacteriales bacterium TMED123]|nr:MAG: noncanonical pyrimidine nucleotidase, YjjG family [Flavobacteriales bacterium TMED123]|tara:strand:- start:10831 stop:11520 length:690 start_codon:yes stop_codon:yes gene_type:complete